MDSVRLHIWPKILYMEQDGISMYKMLYVQKSENASICSSLANMIKSEL